jgi:hypothetical protein
MNDHERAIWAAAYGAAFANDYENIRAQTEIYPHLRGREVNAERAGFVADLAVRRYREWKDTVNNDFGDTIK